MTLIERLESEEGSRELDFRLWCYAHGYEYGGLHENGWCFIFKSPDGFVGSQDMGAVTPHYTTSIDAKLPGENIVAVNKYENDWAAVHQAEDGNLYNGRGKTEALARRIASLKART